MTIRTERPLGSSCGWAGSRARGVPAIGEAQDLALGWHQIEHEVVCAPAAEGCPWPAVLLEAPLPQLAPQLVVIAPGDHAADHIHILGGPDLRHRRIRDQHTSHGPADKHQLLEQRLAQLLSGPLQQGDIGVVGVHGCSRSSNNVRARACSRALPPRTASNRANSSPRAGLRSAASGTLG